MSEEKKELTKKQMAKVTGGARITGYTGSPHCKACGSDMASYGAYYRCTNARCEERGKNKNPNEVSWY